MPFEGKNFENPYETKEEAEKRIFEYNVDGVVKRFKNDLETLKELMQEKTDTAENEFESPEEREQAQYEVRTFKEALKRIGETYKEEADKRIKEKKEI